MEFGWAEGFLDGLRDVPVRRVIPGVPADRADEGGGVWLDPRRCRRWQMAKRIRGRWREKRGDSWKRKPRQYWKLPV